jgi:tetratricopeptide (TPR) repeat protein
MIVKDEAASLPQCLDSVAGVVDEIVVVDTGSTDATREIAAAYNARVVAIDWPNDFAAARNVSLSHATGDWVLVLDADERLDAEISQQLRQLDQGQLQSGFEAADILAVNLLRQEIGAPQAPYTLITRFFRRLPTIQFFRPYHETVDDSIAALQQQQPRWQVLTLDRVGLYHTGYAPEVVIQRDKFSRAQFLMELHLQQHPEDPYILNKLAALYLEQNRADDALPLLNRALTHPDALDDLTSYELYYHRALACGQEHPDQATKDYGEALQRSLPPRLKLGALINFGNLKKARGDLPGAISLFQQAIDADPTFAIAYYNLGVAQRLRGYLDEAIAAYRQAIAIAPYYAEAHQNLGVALFKLGKLPEAIQSFGYAARIYEKTNPAQAESLKQKVKALGIPSSLLAQSYFE